MSTASWHTPPELLSALLGKMFHRIINDPFNKLFYNQILNLMPYQREIQMSVTTDPTVAWLQGKGAERQVSL